ncbi:MAG: anaerobic ribonucleoside-triphosphate reductase [Desulfovibrionaceae bacterium]
MFVLTRTDDKSVADLQQVGKNVGFERTRRITGYLVGTLDRFNNAKRAEEKNRVKHGA